MSIVDIRPGLRVFLLADAAVAALVGVRFYAGQLPQGVILTSLVYNEISSVGDHHMQGPSGLARPRYQIDAWAQNADAASNLALAVKNRLDGYSGVFLWGGSPQASVTVQGILFDSSRDLYDSTARLYGKGQDFIIWFAER